MGLRCLFPCRKSCKSPERPRVINPTAVISGTKNQNNLPGKYAGIQCTSICLAALFWWHCESGQGRFSTETIDSALDTGNLLHKYFREELRVSTDEDLRVSLEDLPENFMLGNHTFVRDHDEEKFALLYPPTGDSGDFLMLETFLTEHAGSPFGVLITVGEYTHAIFLNSQNKWAVFDSHGHLKFKCRGRKPNASVWEFDSIHGVLGFLSEIHSSEYYCQVFKPKFERVEPEPIDNSVELVEVIEVESKTDTESTIIGSLHSSDYFASVEDLLDSEVSTIRITVSPAPTELLELDTQSHDYTYLIPIDDEDEGYVSFMGGFWSE